MKYALLIIVFLFSLESYSQEKKEITVTSEVKEATIFIEGAQVLRKKTIELPAGKSILKFKGLSPYMDTKSIQVKSSNDVIVLSVNHQFNYLDTIDKTKETEELNKSLEKLDNRIKEQNAYLSIMQDEMLFYKQNMNLSGKDKGITFMDFKEFSYFYHEKISSFKLKEIEIDKTIDELNNQKALIQKQLTQIGNVKSNTMSEILLNVELKTAGKSEFEISYFVNNAGWRPSYDIRAINISEPVELVYKANVFQNTKEDWKNIKVTLSSSSPNKSGVAPEFKTYFLDYNVAPPVYNLVNNTVSGIVYNSQNSEAIPFASVIIKGTTIGTMTDENGRYSLSIPNNADRIVVSYIGFQQQEVAISGSQINIPLKETTSQLSEVQINYNKPLVSGVSNDENGYTGGIRGQRSNGSIMYVDGIKVSKSKSLPQTAFEQVNNQTSFEFDIKIPYTFNSDNKSYSVSIDSYMLPASFEYYCIPKIDKDVFLMAHIVDWEKYNLLEGEANIFFENTYVGKSLLNTRNFSDTLSLSLGRDKSVIVKRDKIKTSTSKQFFGNKREETRGWTISVRNNKKQKINMILFDQAPISTNTEIEVNNVQLSNGIFNKDSGEIKWKFELEAASKKDFELIYKVRYPKSRYLNIE